MQKEQVFKEQLQEYASKTLAEYSDDVLFERTSSTNDFLKACLAEIRRRGYGVNLEISKGSLVIISGMECQQEVVPSITTGEDFRFDPDKNKSRELIFRFEIIKPQKIVKRIDEIK